MAGKSKNSDSVAAEHALAHIRKRKSRVHCIVNEAAVSVTANTLSAVGANPSMTYSPHDIADFTESADALSVNLGMLTDSKCEAISIAVQTACEVQIPWVLDPAFINRSGSRLQFCQQLLDQRPDVVRGNSDEIDALCNAVNLTKQELARKHAIVVMTTGATDHFVSDYRTKKVTQGHQWMDHVTGMGCALSALLAAFLSVVDDAWEAATEVARIYSEVGSEAAARSSGPGTYIGNFIDCLYDQSIA